ncbi:GNAT family N-acetyltransferase [Massilia glaciei]|uniref:GNAT family N-acetyltransferase n=1 Tax=Massilia glaciei TaxID=1524097 RepID=A0A2U2HND9_9BURK|nr:GNAT family N-acetyltransferase [Massilia glaciei]PWF48925.1 GNAT family N-acetyltransferase [Massilia glaciei]
MILDRAGWPAAREQLEALFLTSFGRAIAPGYLDWRYCDNDQERQLFALERGGAGLAASYSAFPVELEWNGKRYSSAMSMTTMTHPAWRGKGLFPKLAGELYAEAARQGVAAIWGFPNNSSHPAFVGKLGWSDIYEIPTMALALGAIDAQQFALDGAVARDDQFSLDYTDLPSDGLIRVRRTPAYLRWRYARNPVNDYQTYVLAPNGIVSSFVVTKKYGDGVDLVDIQGRDPRETALLLSHIVKSSHAAGMRQLSCWAPAHHAVHLLLARLGFENTAPVTYFGARRLIAAALPDGWSDYKNWYVQMGDSDVF